jgi:hypothetical protein
VTDLISAPTDPQVVVASPQGGIELLSQSSVMERVAMSRELRGL